jgi:hypothetical protein
MVELSKDPMLTDHEVRIRILERDYAEIKEIRGDVKTLQLDVSGLKSSISALPEQLREHFKAELKSELGAHEINEARYQSKILWAVLALALSVIGSAMYLAAEQVADRIGDAVSEHSE